MKINGEHFRSIWFDHDSEQVMVIDQRELPFSLKCISLNTVDDTSIAINQMAVRGAPLIGATAAWGMWLATKHDPSDSNIMQAAEQLESTRPTAINLSWALNRMLTIILELPQHERSKAAKQHAEKLCDEDVETNKRIGDYGLALLKKMFATTVSIKPINILTHCNAGWLATVDWGTALAPVFKAHEAGIDIHVWVDETRPRNQGASLTAWELQAHGVAHTVVTDNAGGHLMQEGQVDVCLVGSDRTARNGDVCNKVGTYLKALAAFDNGVPFYAAVPSSTIDWSCQDGVNDIPIEHRPDSEVRFVTGITNKGIIEQVRITPETSSVANPAFDVTPSRLVTGLITDQGIIEASAETLSKICPRWASNAPS